MRYAAMIGYRHVFSGYMGRLFAIEGTERNSERYVGPTGIERSVYDPGPSDSLIVGKVYDYVVLEIPE